jgi:hypothetical protein
VAKQAQDHLQTQPHSLAWASVRECPRKRQAARTKLVLRRCPSRLSGSPTMPLAECASAHGRAPICDASKPRERLRLVGRSSCGSSVAQTPTARKQRNDRQIHGCCQGQGLLAARVKSCGGRQPSCRMALTMRRSFANPTRTWRLASDGQRDSRRSGEAAADPPEADRREDEGKGEEDRHLVPLEGPVATSGLVGHGFVELGGEFRYAGLEGRGGGASRAATLAWARLRECLLMLRACGPYSARAEYPTPEDTRLVSGFALG